MSHELRALLFLAALAVAAGAQPIETVVPEVLAVLRAGAGRLPD